ncbi:MAG: hypothetical protein VX335_00020 [Pseudomonadota bacterium]|nr:hypothetical protein [Pseudomonadota bacterium]
MLVILNPDSLGDLIITSLIENHIKHMVLKSSSFISNLVIAQDKGGAYLVYYEQKLYIDNISGLYCGKAKDYKGKFTCSDFMDWYYIQNSWNSYLSYFLALIPRQIGVTKSELWSGSLLQLPCLFKSVEKYGVLCPKYYESYENSLLLEFTKVGEWYFLETLHAFEFDNFQRFGAKSILAVEKLGTSWVLLVFIGKSYYALINKDGAWGIFSIDVRIVLSMVKFLLSFSLNMAEFLFRYDSLNMKFYCYGMNLSVSRLILKHYSEDIVKTCRSMIC